MFIISIDQSYNESFSSYANLDTLSSEDLIFTPFLICNATSMMSYIINDYENRNTIIF